MAQEQKMPANNALRPRTAAPRQADSDMMTPKDILAIFRRHTLMIFTTTILGILISGTAWYLLRKYAPKYTAKTIFRVLAPVERDPMAFGTTAAGKDMHYGYRLSLANLIKRQDRLDKLLARDKIKQTRWFMSLGQTQGARLREAIMDLGDNFSAVAQKNTEFITISMTCGSKVESALIVNEMLELFIAEEGTKKRQEVTDRLAKLEERRDRVEQDLAFAEDALDDVRERWEIIDLEDRGNEDPIVMELNRLDNEENLLLLEIRQFQANMKNLERLATGPITEQIEHQIENDPIMTNLASQIAFQESELAAKMTKFGENHRVVRQLQQFINETKERRELRKSEIARQTRISNLQDSQDHLVILSQRLEELNKLIEEARAQKKDLDLARIQYDQRTSVRDERKRMLDDIKNRVEKLRIMHDDPQTPKVQFVGFAPVPMEISSPRLGVYLPGGTMMGLMLGLGLAFLIELLNDLVRTPKDVSKYLHLRLLGMIPDASEDEQADEIDPASIVRDAPYSIISECYRRFRANLKLLAPADSLKALLVTSPIAGEGKTSTAVNLATAFIAEEKNILLIDTNFRRPGFGSIFNDDSDETTQKGLSSFLRGKSSLDDIIRSNVIEGLDVINAGAMPTNPTELLDSNRMKNFIQQQRDNYDHIIIDGPPVLLVSDAKIMTGLVDATILVFNTEETRRGVALRSIRELRQINATIAGCVLLGVKSLKGGYFREQFKSYKEYQKPQLVTTS